jgi:hypothetical protein
MPFQRQLNQALDTLVTTAFHEQQLKPQHASSSSSSHCAADLTLDTRKSILLRHCLHVVPGGFTSKLSCQHRDP